MNNEYSESNEEYLPEKILQFIQNIFLNSFDRMKMCDEDCGFDNYDEFIEHNETCIMKLSNDDLQFIGKLIDKINKKYIVQCDEENFIEWVSYAIYFNINNKLVIMHPR